MSDVSYPVLRGRESTAIPGHFGDPVHVEVARYSIKQANAYPTRPLLVLLHGWGANEDDLSDLLRVIAPTNDAIALRAPLELVEGAYSWFHDMVPQGADRDYDMYAASVAIDEWVRQNVPSERDVVLIGFSQGASLAVHTLRLHPDRYRAGVCFSGFLATNMPETSRIPLKDKELAERNVPVFLGYGVGDQIIPRYEFSATAAWLEDHVWLEEHCYRGLDHAINMEELGDVRNWFALHDIAPGLI